MRIQIRGFKGEAPRFSARALPSEYAQTAMNVDLRSLAIRPWNVPLFTNTPSKAGTKLTIYLWAGAYWFHWTTDVDVWKGPLHGDTTKRTYYTGDGYPKMTDSALATSGGGTGYPTASLRLGLPAPASAVTAVADGTPSSADESLKELRYYLYTYVSSRGEEGPPSPVSASVEVYPGQHVDLSGMSVAPSGAYDVTQKRIYRSNAGTSSAAFQFVAQIAVATTVYEDTLAGAALQEVLPSYDWVAPPDSMFGLVLMPNGFFAGFDSNEVLFSEPYQPHAWPTAYRLSTAHDIVGGAAFDQNLVVCTAANPYIVRGSDPEGMSMELVNIGQGCVSKRSIVGIGSMGVIYASANGLVMVGNDGAQLITAGIMTGREWATINPASLHGYNVGGRYHGFFTGGSRGSGGLIFDPNTPDFVTFTDVYATAGFADPAQDALFMQVGNDIVKWDAGATPQTFNWRSKKIALPIPSCMSAAQVIADTYTTLTCKIYADGALKHTQTVTSREPFRLPGGFRAEVWELLVYGTSTVQEVLLAETISELATV